MGAIAVRSARSEDVELLVAFNQRMAHETEGKALDGERLTRGVRAVFDEPRRGSYFVAEGDGEPLGACLVTREWSDWRAADFWWLQSVYVVPEARRRGVFRALYDHVLASARRAPDVCGIRLYVENENEAAQAVYHRVGMGESHYRLFEIDFVLGAPGAGS